MAINVGLDLGQFLNRIWDATSFYFARPRSRVKELDRVAERLTAKLEDVNREIVDAERNGQIATGATKLWQRRAEACVSTEVTAIRQDFTAMQCLGGWSWNCVSINLRVTEKLKEVQELVDQVEVPTFAARIQPPPAVELPISNNVVGMQSNVIQIVNQIKDEQTMVIGIYGMWGIGKTTLLKLIHNHEDISKLKFEYVVWIVASNGCKLRKLQMDLAQKLGLNLKDDSEDAYASQLFNFLKEKNCLLFLDDIWESYELVKLGMEQAKQGKGKSARW